MRKITFILILLTMLPTRLVRAADVVWFDGQHPVTYQIVGRTDPVVKIALQMFCDDIRQVTGLTPVASKQAVIRIVQGRGTDDGFRLRLLWKDRTVAVRLTDYWSFRDLRASRRGCGGATWCPSVGSG